MYVVMATLHPRADYVCGKQVLRKPEEGLQKILTKPQDVLKEVLKML